MPKPETEDNRSPITSGPSRNLPPSEIPEALNLAVQHHNDGDLTGAGDAYRRIPQTEPRQDDALHLLGLIAFQEGAFEKAVELITKALDVNPAFPAAPRLLWALA